MRRQFARFVVIAQVTAIAVTAPTGAPSATDAGLVSAAASAPVHSTSSRPSREVFGYALASSLADPTFGYPSWNFSLLSTVAFFGVHVNSNGSLVNDSGLQTWNSSAGTNFINTAHASGVKVLLTIVLQDFSAGTPAMCAGLANANMTIPLAVQLMKDRGADGISVDYEGLNGTCANGQSARAMMTAFVQSLRNALGSAPYLSVATYGSSAGDTIGFFDVPGIAPYANSFFVMAYDLEYSNYHRAPLGCSSFCLSPTAALTTYFWNDSTVIAQYLAVVPASQVILGVPYYGRKACVAGAVPNAYPISSVTAESYLNFIGEATDSAVRPGSYAAHRDVHDTVGLVRWDTWFNTSLNCTRELYIDDAQSLGKKYDLVNQNQLRGVGVWTLNYGGAAQELWNAIAGHFATCASVATTTGVASPQPAGVQVVITAAATPCPNPLYAFWMLPPGGTWTLAQAYTSRASFTWTTAGARAGTYRFSVWARDSSGLGVLGTAPNTYDAFNAFDFTVTPTCPTMTSTSAPASTASIGTPVTVTGSASGCPNPRYQFWLLPPGGPWSVVQAYSAAPTYTWSTVGKGPGTYRFSVWTRDATSPNAYDGFAAFDYTLAVKPCTGMSATVAPATSAPAGTSLAITAAATGCPNPQYEVWVLPPGGSWFLARGYSTAAVFNWSSSGKPAGQYRFSVWARDLSSGGAAGTPPYTYDSFAALQYGLTPVCSGVTVTTLPSGAAGVGNTITITATASGCPNPVYQFWILAPGQAWTLVQPYSTSAVVRWPTTGKAAGSYRISVWVRDASSTGVAGAAPNTYDAFNAFAYSLV